MIFTPIAIPGACLVDLERRDDERGFFARAWCRREFAAQGLTAELSQVNLAWNRAAGTFRGMHYQAAPSEEAKLVRCLRGAIFDIALDLRPASPTFRQWAGFELSDANRRALLVPEGCAHGYLTLRDDCEVLYQVSACYDPDRERGARWDDPAFGIALPAPVRVISAKDRDWPDFSLRQSVEVHA